ncbi:relaxase/mobilization nuclease-like protein [Pontibacter ummariensis]|uniref:Relaxase/Mobilisation nuclease domain-containing protein n=1 Tax=Pontibacter ummariensis TaxID=1610492 RepID=A0A239LFY3_9BACT|nr:relaxase/mobilization nuclease domain-containing protein [Pontibacter ummariensis]PRY03642.1 relaxase/mobilization nuclease-like protein [Pontibacter ummariensis]SNT28852.1 Relaxase/Mobilisation nuclease domain-containing protein [Pontibacter ummariensis]
MVAKIITGKNLSGVLHYNEHKVSQGKAELLLAHRFLQEPQTLQFREKLSRFERLLEKSPQVRTHAVHISLNFAMGEALEREKLQRIATDYMDRIGFDAQPYLVYRHLDAAHPHLHIVTTNIRADGKRIDLHNIGREKSEPARKAIELAYGLVRAEAHRQTAALPLQPTTLEPAQYGKSETKRTISRIVQEVTRSYNYTSLAELNTVLQTFNVTADRGKENSQMHRKGGLVYSILDRQGQKVGVPIKASAIAGKPTLINLEKRFEQNRQHRKLYKEALKKCLDRALHRAPPLRRERFVQLLEKENIQVVFRESAGGMTYGVTFIDHRRRAVFNGSELGKAYSAKALLERLSEGAKESAGENQRQDQSARKSPTTQKALPSPAKPVAFRIDAPAIVQDLLKAEQQGDYLPHALKTRKKKRRRRSRL